ncbi:unnamed protein product [Umbelopsis sp. WA50703]
MQQPHTSFKYQEPDISSNSSRQNHSSFSDKVSNGRERDNYKHTRPRLRRLSTPDLTDTLTNSRSDSESELNSPTYRHNSRSSPQLSIPGAWPPTPLIYTEEPEELPVEGLSDEFDYVILRVPTKSRASSIASRSTSRRSVDSSRRGSVEELTEKSISRLSTPEATRLVESIKALKTPALNHSKSSVVQTIEDSSNWKVDDMGKYEYLVLRSSSQSTVKARMSEELDKVACESDEESVVLDIATPGFPLDDIADQWQVPPQSISTTQRAYSYSEITASSLAFKPDEVGRSSPYQLEQPAFAFDVPKRLRSRSLTNLRPQSIPSIVEPPHSEYMTPEVPEHRIFKDNLERSASGSQKLHRILSTLSSRSLQSLRQTTNMVNTKLEESWDNNDEELSSPNQQPTLTRKYTLSRPSFWDPARQVPSPSQHVSPKPSFAFRLRSILQPRKMRVRSQVRQQHLLERGWAVERARSPCIPYMQDLGIHHSRINPFAIINKISLFLLLRYTNSNTWEEGEGGRHLSFRETDFNQVDAYARTVRQNGATITPEHLATKYIVRPYRRDIQKVRAIFMWIIENIRVGVPQDTPSPTGGKNHSPDNDTEGSIGGFGTSTHAEQVEKDWVETAELVLSKRWCRTGVGFARLFCEMAVAAGLEETKVVYGYLRVPKDNQEVATRSNGKIKINHACLPHVRTPFFKHHLQVLDYEYTFLDLIDDDGVF